MKTALLIIGGLGAGLAVYAPAMRALRERGDSRMTDQEYFAAARRRAISFRLAAKQRKPKTTGDE